MGMDGKRINCERGKGMTYSTEKRDTIYILELIREYPELVLVLERALNLEQEGATKEYYLGWEWYEVKCAPQTLNKLVLQEVIEVAFKSVSGTNYRLCDSNAVSEAIEMWKAGVGFPEAEGEQIEIPDDLFDVITGHEKVKKLIKLSLNAEQPVHILLVGPPATAKSVFLLELKRLPKSRYALGGTSSKAGIAEFIIEERPRYLLIDELDKMEKSDYSALLSLMESGIITRLKKGMTEEVKVKAWVFAGANRDDSFPPELRSRFIIRYLPEYTQDEYEKVVTAVLTRREGVAQDIAACIAEKVASYSRDVRDAIKVARLLGDGKGVGLDEVINLVFT
jgi:Holliday junction DNA helicase RuvB